ncbi:hypothetical protein KAR28_04895 [Candidatus Parcubacteria bacterium]|nr:hypothetical protein [Candidatus Parcubacteria bacterium]
MVIKVNANQTNNDVVLFRPVIFVRSFASLRNSQKFPSSTTLHYQKTIKRMSFRSGSGRPNDQGDNNSKELPSSLVRPAPSLHSLF